TFVPIEFSPTSSKFAYEKCGGINIVITDRSRLEPLRTGLEIAAQLRRLYPDKWEAKSYDRLLGNQKTLQALLDGQSSDQIAAVAREGVSDFLRRRQKYLLYE
ncbi:MAG TPA: DUF1343 domain-containing protein, partial [Pirellulaceae bacterium]|nr:DUF1343 domain-containing protein [Pirellulaceae bacterium]